MDPIITLTTDFGADSPYVAALRGVILSMNSRVRLVDLSHQIPPQNIRLTAFFLRATIPYFPSDTIHVVVVDPGVGTERALLYVEVDGHRLLAPDNGCWTGLIHQGSQPPTVIRLAESCFWRHPVSPTFHGRDILAPVAAHLSLGEDPRRLGKPYQDWIQLEIRPPILEHDRLMSEVIFIDHFGNLITDIPGQEFVRICEKPTRIMVGDFVVNHRVRTYAEAEPGTVVALISSLGFMEVAVTNGNAAEKLGARLGTPVSVQVT
jgi:S-adenosylmethionine hydrolase